MQFIIHTEVCEYDVSVAVEEYVLQLDVPVDDAVLVELLEGEHDLADVDAHLVLSELLPLVEMREQLAAVHVICKGYCSLVTPCVTRSLDAWQHFVLPGHIEQLQRRRNLCFLANLNIVLTQHEV